MCPGKAPGTVGMAGVGKTEDLFAMLPHYPSRQMQRQKHVETPADDRSHEEYMLDRVVASQTTKVGLNHFRKVRDGNKLVARGEKRASKRPEPQSYSLKSAQHGHARPSVAGCARGPAPPRQQSLRLIRAFAGHVLDFCCKDS